MSLESFSGFDSSEPMSAAALEKLQERMRKAAAQIKALRKQEGKQKKKEDELIKILLAFVQSSHKTDLVLLISRALERNLPANFILALLLLGNPEIQQAIGHFLPIQTQVSNILEGTETHALTFFGEQDHSLPLKIKIELDYWIKHLLIKAEDQPQKLLKTAYTFNKEGEKELEPALINLMAGVLRYYLDEKQVNESFDKLKNFCGFVLKGILEQIQKTVDGRGLLN